MTERKKSLSTKFNNLKINPEASAAFQLQQDEGSNPMRIALNDRGERILLKTTIAFTEDGSVETATLSPNNLKKFLTDQGNPETFDQEYAENIDALFAEEQASRIAQHLGIKVPEAKLVFLEETPFIAYEHLDNLRDTFFGAAVKISGDPAVRKNQEWSLASGALLKALLKTYDDGQFLQIDQDGEIFLSDLGVRSRKATSSETEFEKEIKEYFVPRNGEILAHQVAGIQSPEFADLLRRLNDLDYDTILELIARDPKNPTDREKAKATTIISRKNYVSKLFKDIRNSPREMMQKILDLQNGIS